MKQSNKSYCYTTSKFKSIILKDLKLLWDEFDI